MHRLLFPLLIGLGGVAVLVWLGVWQVQRLGWKQQILAQIEARIVDPAVPLPAQPDEDTDRYLPVKVEGRFDGALLQVLASIKHVGPVHRVIVPFETEGRRVLVDLGWIAAGDDLPHVPQGPMTLTGNLDWPRETDSFTAAPDARTGLWFARDVPAMAEVLGTDPVLVVLRKPVARGFAITPLPVTTEGIPNDHLHYAITWFSLAAVWAGMTGFYIYRGQGRVS